MKTQDAFRLGQIHRRLEEYEKHRHEPYSYDEKEIKEVRELHNNASEDIKFLLSLLPTPSVK